MPARGDPLLGGVELGGTKCVCVLGTGPEDIRARGTVATGADPQATLGAVARWLRDAASIHGGPRALGIASFGPLDLEPASPTYGWITATPKPGWSRTEVAPRLGRALDVPVALDTDVNGAALAERRWGAARGLQDFAYVTVGTGIGVGLMVEGRLVHGMQHPELGHIRIVRSAGDGWSGACAFHGDCLEGLASGAAIAARTGQPAESIGDEHPVWDLTARALAQLLHTLVLATAPRRIIVGGGVVAARPNLLAAARRHLLASLNGYPDRPEFARDLAQFVTAPGLGTAAGALGALALASRTLAPDRFGL